MRLEFDLYSERFDRRATKCCAKRVRKRNKKFMKTAIKKERQTHATSLNADKYARNYTCGAVQSIGLLWQRVFAGALYSHLHGLFLIFRQCSRVLIFVLGRRCRTKKAHLHCDAELQHKNLCNRSVSAVFMYLRVIFILRKRQRPAAITCTNVSGCACARAPTI